MVSLNKKTLNIISLILLFVGTLGLTRCSSSRSPYREEFQAFSKSLKSDGMKTSNLKIESRTLSFEIHSLNDQNINVSALDNLSDPPPNHPAILDVMKRVGLIMGRVTLRYRQHFIGEDSSGSKNPPILLATLPDSRGKDFLTLKMNRNAIRLAENLRDIAHRKKGELFQAILRFNTSLQSGKVLKRALEKQYGITMRELTI